MPAGLARRLYPMRLDLPGGGGERLVGLSMLVVASASGALWTMRR